MSATLTPSPTTAGERPAGTSGTGPRPADLGPTAIAAAATAS